MTLAILPYEWITTCSYPGLPPLICETRFFGQLSVFVHLLLRVPEPLIDLVLFEVELVGELGDLLAGGCLSLKALVQIPERIFLALRLAGTVGFSLGSGHLLLFCFTCGSSLLGRWTILRSRCVGEGKRRFSLLIGSILLTLSSLCLGLFITLTSSGGSVWGLWNYRFGDRLSARALVFWLRKCVLNFKCWSSISCWLLSPSIVWRIAADERKVLLNFIVGSRCRSANLAENVIPSNLAWLTWLCKRS